MPDPKVALPKLQRLTMRTGPLWGALLWVSSAWAPAQIWIPSAACSVSTVDLSAYPDDAVVPTNFMVPLSWGCPMNFGVPGFSWKTFLVLSEPANRG